MKRLAKYETDEMVKGVVDVEMARSTMPYDGEAAEAYRQGLTRGAGEMIREMVRGGYIKMAFMATVKENLRIPIDKT